jgi:hypothetical protein
VILDRALQERQQQLTSVGSTVGQARYDDVRNMLAPTRTAIWIVTAQGTVRVLRGIRQAMKWNDRVAADQQDGVKPVMAVLDASPGCPDRVRYRLSPGIARGIEHSGTLRRLVDEQDLAPDAALADGIPELLDTPLDFGSSGRAISPRERPAMGYEQCDRVACREGDRRPPKEPVSSALHLAQNVHNFLWCFP